RDRRSATATSGLPSTLKSPTTVDQPRGLAAFPSLNCGSLPARIAVGADSWVGKSLKPLPSQGEAAGRVADKVSARAKHTSASAHAVCERGRQWCGARRKRLLIEPPAVGTAVQIIPFWLRGGNPWPSPLPSVRRRESERPRNREGSPLVTFDAGRLEDR